MQHLSNKSRDILWNSVSEEVTQARLKIAKINIEDKEIKNQIDKIMFDLSGAASQKALDCFNYEKER